VSHFWEGFGSGSFRFCNPVSFQELYDSVEQSRSWKVENRLDRGAADSRHMKRKLTRSKSLYKDQKQLQEQ
jgi:hypothetical protein